MTVTSSSADAAAARPFGTPLTPGAIRVILLGAGELGKEVAIELQRLGVEVVAVDRYANAPAMQVAHRSHVVDMLDPEALRRILTIESPDVVIPEVEAIATEVLSEIELGGTRVVPTARAVQLTMNREGIRRLAAEELGLPTSKYRFVDSEEDLAAAVAELGVPCVVKPIMSSSGRGQSVVRTPEDVASAWHHAQADARARATDGVAVRVIVESFVPFDSEITLLTVRHSGGTTFCPPIGHVQMDGDYRESWQPATLPEATLARAQDVARTVTTALGGWGVFGVELFIVGEDVLFSEVSPRPHDTGLVTLISQDRSEFALHARAALGLPVAPPVPFRDRHGAALAGASCAVVLEGSGVPVFDGVAAALAVPGADVRLFGKPRVDGHRRVAVTLARAADEAEARSRARQAARALRARLA